MSDRKYYIDYLRVIAIGILVVFHIMVMYQSYANQIRFIQSPDLYEVLRNPLALFSVMRIPLLFFISGMGVYFSLQRRNWLQMLLERTKRILVPLVFGSFAIVPIHAYIYAQYYSENYHYSPDVAHLWFLINIFMYVLWFLAIFFFAKQIEQSKYITFLKNLFKKSPLYIYVLAIPYLLQALTIPSDIPYALYFDSRVGLLLGAVAFLLGYLIVNIGDVAWKAFSKLKYYLLLLAVILYIIRIIVFEYSPPHLLMAFESITWIFALFGLGYCFLNKPGKLIRYLSSAAYPVYIIHMIFLYWGAYLFFPLELDPLVSFGLITIFTFAGCFTSYEIIRRIFFLRPLFGLKGRRNQQAKFR